MYPSIGTYTSDRTSQNIARIFVDLWASVRNSNVWVKMTEQDKKSLENKLEINGDDFKVETNFMVEISQKLRDRNF